jgi:DNA-directed RNA polymerase specialized sigma24 family protein
MEELEGSARGVSLRAAACILAGDARDPVSGARVRRAVDAQLRRAGVEAQDAEDVRTEVVLALLASPAAHLPLPLELACARAAVIARNKAVDHGRRRARRPIATGGEPTESAAPGDRPGSLADGLDDVTALAHRRRVRADLVEALGRLDEPQRAAIRAHAEGGAARASGLSPSTYYRALAHAQARLSADLRGRLAGLGALGGGAARWARDAFAHVEAAHAVVAATTAAVAVTAAVALSTPGDAAHQAQAVPAKAAGGRVMVLPAAVPAARPLRTRTAVPAERSPVTTASRPLPVSPRRPKAPCIYDPSTYDC